MNLPFIVGTTGYQIHIKHISFKVPHHKAMMKMYQSCSDTESLPLSPFSLSITLFYFLALQLYTLPIGGVIYLVI